MNTAAQLSPDKVERICCIGAGWAAYFLAMGYQVSSYIHEKREEDSLRALIDTAWISLSELGLHQNASLDNLTLTTDLKRAVGDADFVQESAPENLALKQALFKRLDELTRPDVIIASSTSGLPMTDIQQLCAWPARTVVGHPFNPSYLVPLV